MIYLINILIVLLVIFIIKLVLIWVFFYADIRAAQKRDPAAKSFIEIILKCRSIHGGAHVTLSVEKPFGELRGLQYSVH